MKYRLLDLELSEPLQPVDLAPEEQGIGVTARWRHRLVGFRMLACAPGAALSAAALEAFADEHFALAVLAMKAADELDAWTPQPAPMPALSIAICTKDRPQRLARLLQSVAAACERSPFAQTEIVVVDNAPSDDATRQAALRFGVRYVCEPKPGLDFARNAAVAAATGDLLAFLDDDVVVDRGWIDGLARAWRGAQDAGGFTGLVMPYRLDTEAQVWFERNGGFGRGLLRREFRSTSYEFATHPVGAGLIGAGCNMAFDLALVRQLGGFDEALDTGAPLPGGGDLDMFYRVLRSGRTIVYEPRYAIRHEHRETMPQLRRQYWTWGLGMMAFLVKSWRHDPAARPRQRALLRWWVVDQLKSLARAIGRRRPQAVRFCVAELTGGVQGLFGEYDRSLRRVARIKAGGR